MLSRKDKDQYFEVLMALNGFNSIPEETNSMPKENRGVSINDSFGFYSPGARPISGSVQFYDE